MIFELNPSGVYVKNWLYTNFVPCYDDFLVEGSDTQIWDTSLQTDHNVLYGQNKIYHVFDTWFVKIVYVISEREEATQEPTTINPAEKRAKWLRKCIYCQSNPLIQTPPKLELV